MPDNEKEAEVGTKPDLTKPLRETVRWDPSVGCRLGRGDRVHAPGSGHVQTRPGSFPDLDV